MTTSDATTSSSTTSAAHVAVTRSSDAMIEARRRDSATKRARVLTTLADMLVAGDSITVTALAQRAQVSTWLVHAPGIRDAVAHARAQQDNAAIANSGPRNLATSEAADLRADLALARAEITRLRAERAQHHQQLRRALGAQLDSVTRADLVTRIDELTRANTELAAANTQHQSITHDLRSQITALEDQLAAARTSLRRMIRAGNLPPTH